MGKMQISLFTTLEEETLTASKMQRGECFIHKRADNILMRVHPVNYLNNSQLIQDCYNRGRVFVVNIAKGTLYVIDGKEEVERINVKTTVSAIRN